VNDRGRRPQEVDVKRTMTTAEQRVEELCREVEKEFREKRVRKGPATRPLAGPGEPAVRTQPATSPTSGAGAPPQRYPAVQRPSVSEALVLLNATATRIGRRYGRDAGQLAEELAVRTDELVGRVPLRFEAALEQVAREVEVDLIQGRR